MIRIVSDVFAFKNFIGDAAPAIYALMISWLSKIADFLNRGSGKQASLFQSR